MLDHIMGQKRSWWWAMCVLYQVWNFQKFIQSIGPVVIIVLLFAVNIMKSTGPLGNWLVSVTYPNKFCAVSIIELFDMSKFSEPVIFLLLSFSRYVRYFESVTYFKKCPCIPIWYYAMVHVSYFMFPTQFIIENIMVLLDPVLSLWIPCVKSVKCSS